MSEQYDKDDLESMSDLSLNRAVSLIKGFELDGGIKSHQDSGLCYTNYCDDAVFFSDKDYLEREFANYCCNWDDCGELIDELAGVDIEVKSGYVSCGSKYDSPCSFIKDSGSLKRSIVVVYILAKQQNIIT